MKINKLGIVATAMAGLIACGSIARAQDANKDSKDSKNPPPREGRGRGGPEAIKQRLERMTEELKLTDAQKPKVEAALKAQIEKLQGVRDLPQEERREKLQAARDEFNKKMKDILDKEQYEKFGKMTPQRPGGPGRRGPGGSSGPDSEKKADEKK